MANHTPLPLAVAPKPCMHRQIGTDALDQAGIDWRMAFTSPSQRGLRAAVQAGLAITALPQENLEPDWLPSMAGMDCRLCLMQVSG
ncbi:LysR substrate-binding domain-containing protein [Cupriavidus basilensis]|uniref:LysR substrate-binding domain-containing protein n=1 Tax=Cupriavidus basilensis TaxID=68895 RepID=UPI0039F69EB6